MKTVAFLWWENEVEWDKEKPFNKEWKNKDYAEYTELLREKDVRVVCGEYRWYSNGKMRKAFRWNGDKWEKIENIEIDGVYDLFRHDREKYGLKKQMQDEVKVLNDPEVAELCQDKLETYRNFSENMPVTMKASKQNIAKMLESGPRVVLKPRYGSSGEGIDIAEEVPEQIGEDMLVQEFMSADDLPDFDIKGPHDLRILVVDGEPIGSYFRVPDEGFLSNIALGGDQRYVKLEDLPDKVFEIVGKVAEEMNEYEPSIYTVDFMFSGGDPFIVELNSQPGVYYHGETEKEEWERPWMKKIVEAIAEKLQA